MPLSHDNLYHTVLGAAEVRNEVYDRAWTLTVLPPRAGERCKSMPAIDLSPIGV